jgi:transposase
MTDHVRVAALADECADGQHARARWRDIPRLGAARSSQADAVGRGHADRWQVRPAHQLCDCTFAIEAGDATFAPRTKALLLQAVVLARRRTSLAASTRRAYRQRLDRELDTIMALAPTNQHGKRLRKRYGKVRSHPFTFLVHPDAPPDNNVSERELRPTATYRTVTGGF